MTAKTKTAKSSAPLVDPIEEARSRLAQTGRNDVCPCGSGKKYKKCHLIGDEGALAPVVEAPKASDHVANGWRLFEQRRPGAAEKEFHAALALEAGLVDARVGVGMSKLQSGDNDGAKIEFEAVCAASEDLAKDLRSKKVTDAFSRPEAQAYIRAAHALGCLAYDLGQWADAVAGLERVWVIDEGTVGVEARLIAAKAHMKLGKPEDAIAVLTPAAAAKTGAGRAHVGLVLARFAAGDRAGAEGALKDALAANPWFGKALLGQVRKRVDNPALAAPGTREEASLYAQTYGDVWDDAAKAFLEEALPGVAPRAHADTGGEAVADVP